MLWAFYRASLASRASFSFLFYRGGQGMPGSSLKKRTTMRLPKAATPYSATTSAAFIAVCFNFNLNLSSAEVGLIVQSIKQTQLNKK